ncbi:zf-DNL-domain-containing protein [Panus rudis PR-1116 ss-1]|nr:zf-DNL-domain-containing protein [Panus rudis PR-1116 ss-1]
MFTSGTLKQAFSLLTRPSASHRSPLIPYANSWHLPRQSQLHNRLITLGAPRHNSTSHSEAAQAASGEETHKELTFRSHEPRLSLTFTCTVTDCFTRSTHEFTRRSYQRGIVIVECPGCKNRHLIADHLGWFKESTEDGKLKTVEDLVRAKGEKVRRGKLGEGGVIEYTPE